MTNRIERPKWMVHPRKFLAWVLVIVLLDFMFYQFTEYLYNSPVTLRSVWWQLRVEAAGVPPDWLDANRAIFERGNDAAPELIAALGKRDSKIEDLYTRLRSHLPTGLAKKLPLPANATRIRTAAAFHLANLGPSPLPAVEALPALLDCTRSTNRLEQFAALKAIQAIGPKGKAAIPRLQELLKDPDESLRVNAAIALAAIESLSPSLTEVLIAGLQSTNAGIHAEALRGLIKDEKTLIPILLEELKNTNGWRAQSAINVFQMSTDTVKAAVRPGLLAAIRHPNPGTATYAISILMWLKPTGAERETLVREILGRLSAPTGLPPPISVTVRWIDNLGELGLEAHGALPTLLQLVGSAPLRKSAQDALRRIGAPTLDDLPVLLDGLKATNRLVQICALENLSKANFDTHRAIPGLLETLHDSDPEVRSQAAVALSRACPFPDVVVPKMLDQQNDPDSTVRAGALTVISWYGPAAGSVPELVSGLNKALEDASPEVRLTAARVLWQIDPKNTALRAAVTGILGSTVSSETKKSAREFLKQIDAPGNAR